MILKQASSNLEKKREYYLQIMHKARQINDQGLIRLITRKLIHLDPSRTMALTSGCSIIPFPLSTHIPRTKHEKPTIWTYLKVAMIFPGSLIVLILLSHYLDVSAPINTMIK
jgi:hypothetical protein